MNNKFLEIAINAAVSGGNILMQNYGKIIKSSQKESLRDIVTEIDALSEKEIVKVIQHSSDKYGILTEEQGQIGHLDNSYWIVDALDGTVNYIHQIPLFSVSVAFVKNGQPVAGAIYNPLAEDLFYGLENTGCFKNQKKLFIKDTPLSSSLTAAAFSGKAYNKKNRSGEFELFGRINDLSQGCLRTGSAAMNLAYVSAGNFGACWGNANKFWDIAAGLLFARLSGAVVKFHVVDDKKHLVNYLAATPKCWEELEPIVSDVIKLD